MREADSLASQAVVLIREDYGGMRDMHCRIQVLSLTASQASRYTEPHGSVLSPEYGYERRKSNSNAPSTLACIWWPESAVESKDLETTANFRRLTNTRYILVFGLMLRRSKSRSHHAMVHLLSSSDSSESYSSSVFFVIPRDFMGRSSSSSVSPQALHAVGAPQPHAFCH